MCEGKTIFLLLTLLLTPNVWLFTPGPLVFYEHKLGVLQFNLILTVPGVSTVPQVESSVPQDWSPRQMPITNLDLLYF